MEKPRNLPAPRMSLRRAPERIDQPGIDQTVPTRRRSV
jgi:hypothetical protein